MKRVLRFLLSGLLIALVCVTSTPTQVGKESQRVDKVKQQVNKIGARLLALTHDFGFN
jgi:hypothetical protein